MKHNQPDSHQPHEIDLVKRSGDLKRALVEYTLQPRFERILRQELDQYAAEVPETEGVSIENLVDQFMLQHRLRDGRTVVEHFVAEHPELPPAEREMLLGWQDVVEGIFEVERREGEAIIVTNLVDELTYRVRSNMGPRAITPLRPGSSFYSRLVPVGAEWLLSGVVRPLTALSRDEVYALAAEFAAMRPELVFRNKEKLEKGWELQRKERQVFVTFFGSDLVVLPGREMEKQIQAFLQSYIDKVSASMDETERQRAEAADAFDPQRFRLPDELREEATVGAIFDEVEGLAFFPEYGLVAEVFANPDLAKQYRYRKAVLNYLENPAISPLPLRRLAERDPERASQVFQRVLKRPRFSWERDADGLLRHYKPEYFASPPLPAVVPVNLPAAGAPLQRSRAAQSALRRGRGQRGRK